MAKTKTPPDDGEQQNDDQTPPDDGEQVKALVLSDCIYGKCGEVKSFPARDVEAIRAAGYIDPHPNAVKSVEG